jgi:hypothetical protein
MPAPEFLQQPQKQVKTIPIPLVAVAGVAVIAAGLWIWSRVSQPAQPSSPETVAEAPASPPAEPAAAAPADGQAAQPASAPAAADGATAPVNGQPTAPPAGQAPAQPDDRSLFTRAGDAVRSAVGSLVGSSGSAPASPAPAAASASTPSAAPAAATPRPRRPRPAPAKATASATPPAASETPTAPVPAVAARSAEVLPVPVGAASGPVFDEPVEVFTANDNAVTPPVIVRPVLPKDPPPDVPLEDIGVVEVVVDENGDVLHVKLISPANRYRERMLVSASKMWKFRPAYKDGRPVRYKTRVRLTV